MGHGALTSNTTSYYSTAMGYEALLSTTGTYNTGYGAAAGRTNTVGSDNTCIGGLADLDSVGRINASAIGYSAIAKKNNTMMFGNSAVTGLYTTVGLFATSDGRFKINVKEDVKGLEFIKKLRPVTYNLDSKKLDDFMTQNMSDEAKTAHKAGMDFKESTAKIHSGFIAQEVEEASKAVGYKSSIVSAPSTSSDAYAVNYAEIVVPLVKAVQEQQTMIEKQQQQIEELKKLVAGAVPSLPGSNTTSGTNSTTAINATSVQLSDADVVVLNQNQPNPFAEQTTITYNVPQNANSAQILFYDINGKQIKSQNITTKGEGALNVYASDLSNGTYSYTLVVDGKVIDTKKMLKQQ